MKKGSKSEIAQNYAQALYDAAVQEKNAETLFAELNDIRQAFTHPETIRLLNNPVWTGQNKKDAVDEICRKIKLSPLATNFVQLLVENRRLDILNLALEAFEHIYHRAQGVEEIVVESVQPLSAAQVKKLENGLEKNLGRPIAVTYRINPDILGGLTVQHGSILIDDSIKGKLNRLEKAMKGNV